MRLPIINLDNKNKIIRFEKNDIQNLFSDFSSKLTTYAKQQAGNVRVGATDNPDSDGSQAIMDAAKAVFAPEISITNPRTTDDVGFISEQQSNQDQIINGQGQDISSSSPVLTPTTISRYDNGETSPNEIGGAPIITGDEPDLVSSVKSTEFITGMRGYATDIDRRIAAGGWDGLAAINERLEHGSSTEIPDPDYVATDDSGVVYQKQFDDSTQEPVGLREDKLWQYVGEGSQGKNAYATDLYNKYRGGEQLTPGEIKFLSTNDYSTPPVDDFGYSRQFTESEVRHQMFDYINSGKSGVGATRNENLYNMVSSYIDNGTLSVPIGTTKEKYTDYLVRQSARDYNYSTAVGHYEPAGPTEAMYGSGDREDELWNGVGGGKIPEKPVESSPASVTGTSPGYTDAASQNVREELKEKAIEKVVTEKPVETSPTFRKISGGTKVEQAQPIYSEDQLNNINSYVTDLQNGTTGREDHSKINYAPDTEAIQSRLENNYTPEQKAEFFAADGSLTEKGQNAVRDAYMYGDLTEQEYNAIYSGDPYYNPFSKESLDALPEATRNELLNRQDEVGKIIRETYYGTTDGTPNTTSTTSSTNQSSIITNALDKQLIDAARGMNDVQRQFLFSQNPGLEAKYNAVLASEQSAESNTFTTTNSNIKNSSRSQSTVSIKDQQLIDAAKDMNDVQRQFLFSQNPGLEEKYNSIIAEEEKTSIAVTRSSKKATSTSSKSTTTKSNRKKSNTTSEKIKTTNTDIEISLKYDTIRYAKSRLTLCIEELENTIKSIETEELTTINNSWIANEAKVYTNKVVNSNNITHIIIEVLKLLDNAYNQVLDEAESTSNAVSTAINNI